MRIDAGELQPGDQRCDRGIFGIDMGFRERRMQARHRLARIRRTRTRARNPRALLRRECEAVEVFVAEGGGFRLATHAGGSA